MEKDNIENNLEKEQLKNILKMQEEFLFQKYAEKDFLIKENNRLSSENSKFLRTIILDQCYINYLLNSFWWKITFPLRKVSGFFHIKKISKYNYIKNITNDTVLEPLDVKISVIIFTCNSGPELELQLNNIVGQKLVKNIEIIIVDRGSEDKTVDIAKKYTKNVIEISDSSLTDSEIYEKILPKISGEYIAIVEEGKILNSKFWIYQMLKPIIDNMSTISIVLENKIDFFKKNIYSKDLKSRIGFIDNEQVIFLPENRDIIQFITPKILDKTSIIIKKKVSNLFLI